MSSEDGWEPAWVDQDALDWITVAGTGVSLQLLRGIPATIMGAYAADYNAYVEPLRDADSAGYTPTNSVATSNHLNGTAMDLNWDSHPFRVSFAGYTPEMTATMRELLDFYENTMFWAQDWDDPKDCMHHQMDYGTYEDQARCQDFIARKIRSDGFSTFRRGDTVPLSRADQYALAIIGEGQRRGITVRGIKIALATALVESNLTMYANSNDPASMNLPHDAVGSDHMSTGIFQQQNFAPWGTLECRMDAACSAGLFYTQLVKLDYNNPANSPGSYAQDVQGSAFPDRYDQRFADAEALYDRLATTTAPPPAPPPEPPAPPEGPFMALTAQQQQQMYDALCGAQSSQSRYADPKDLWTLPQFVRNNDGFVFDLITEHDAALGDTTALARVRKAATAGDTIAQRFIEQLAGAAAPAPYVVPPVPAAAAPLNNIVCWNCGKRYPDALLKCPFCGAGNSPPRGVIPAPPQHPPPAAAPVATPPPATPAPAPAVTAVTVPAAPIADVVAQLTLLQRFAGVLPAEVVKSVTYLIPVLQTWVDEGPTK